MKRTGCADVEIKWVRQKHKFVRRTEPKKLTIKGSRKTPEALLKKRF